MSWGGELWDKYGEVAEHTQSGIEFLVSVASFIKEQGKIEDQYSKALKSLVKKHSFKPSANAKGQPMEEFTYIRAFKQMLEEVIFTANQHDVLAENFTKERYKSIQESVKKLKERRKKNIKSHDKITHEHRQSWKDLDTSREKFRKALDESEKANGAYERANDDGSVSKNELSKLQKVANDKSRQCDEAKGNYARQLVKTNDAQHRHYTEKMPSVLNELQEMDAARIENVREAILSKVAKEREVAPILGKCRDSIEKAMREINTTVDADIVIECNKSGDVPPGDFKFEDMSDPQSLLLSDPTKDKATNLNLYPRKKELERQIAAAESELTKKAKEHAGLETMVSTYQKNPKYGNTKKFQSEMKGLTEQISIIQGDLELMRKELKHIEGQLESLRSRSPMVDSPMLRGVRNTTPRSSQSSGSLKSSSLSIGSAAPMNISPDLTHELQPVYNDPNHQQIYQNDSWDDSEFDNPPAPPPPPPNGHRISSSGSTARVVAVFNYDSRTHELQDSNLPMAKGEEFEIVEPDSDGWTRVRRVQNNYNDEGDGYVPTSYLTPV